MLPLQGIKYLQFTTIKIGHVIFYVLLHNCFFGCCFFFLKSKSFSRSPSTIKRILSSNSSQYHMIVKVNQIVAMVTEIKYLILLIFPRSYYNKQLSNQVVSRPIVFGLFPHQLYMLILGPLLLWASVVYPILVPGDHQLYKAI